MAAPDRRPRPTVRVGQVWQSTEALRAGVQAHVIEVDDRFDDPLIALRAERHSRIRRSNLWRRYRLIIDVKDGAS